jgi:Ca2+/Na+ antiporter
LNASIISYKSAQDVAETNAVIFNDCDIIEASSCSIHGARFFGSTDPKMVSLCCAAVMNSTDMPLFEIMKGIIEQGDDEIKTMSPVLSVICIIGGLAAVIFGGDLVVDSASKIAVNLGMSEALVGLTIVALGTSLPELVTSATAARKGDSGMALGNVVGSNIFNILLILGSSSVLSPIGTNPNTMFDILFWLGVTIFTFVAIALCKKKVNRPVGIAMILLYIAYMIFAIIR